MSYNRKIEDKKRGKSKGTWPYKGYGRNKAKAWDPSCRCNGGCKYCLSNRMHRINRMRTELVDQVTRS